MQSWVIFALLTALFAGIGAIIQKKVLFKEHAMEFCTIRGIFTSLILLLLIPFLDFSAFSLKAVIFIYFVSVLGAIGILYRAKAVRHLEISVVSPMMNLSPLFLLFLTFFILNEPLTLKHFSGILVLLAGSYVLEVDHKIHNLLDPIKKIYKSKFIHYLIFALVIFSFTAMFDKIIIRNYTVYLNYIFLVWFFITINFIIAIFIFHDGWNGIKRGLKIGKFWTFLMALAGLASNLFYAKALSIEIALLSLVVPIKRLSTLFTTVVGGELFHEKGIWLKAFACIIMIAGAYLIIT